MQLFKSSWMSSDENKAVSFVKTTPYSDYEKLCEIAEKTPLASVRALAAEKAGVGVRLESLYDPEEVQKHFSFYVLDRDREKLLAEAEFTASSCRDNSDNSGKGKIAVCTCNAGHSALSVWEKEFKQATVQKDLPLGFHSQLTAALPDDVAAHSPVSSEYLLFIQPDAVFTGRYYWDGMQAFRRVIRVALYRCPARSFMMRREAFGTYPPPQKQGHENGYGDYPDKKKIVRYMLQAVECVGVSFR